MFHRGDDAVHPDFFIGNAGFVGEIEQFHAQRSAFIFIARQSVRTPHQGYKISIVLGCHGHHALIAFGAYHDGVHHVGCSAGNLLDYLQGRFDGIDVGCVQNQRQIRNHLLNRLNHPGHQFIGRLFWPAQG